MEDCSSEYLHDRAPGAAKLRVEDRVVDIPRLRPSLCFLKDSTRIGQPIVLRQANPIHLALQTLGAAGAA